MPEEVLQVHIAGVCHRQVIAHGLAGQYGGVAPLGDGHAKVRRLVKGADLDDLSGKLQRHIMDGGIHLPVGRGGDLHDLIPPQGQRLGGGHAPGVRGDIIHNLAAALLDDLVDGALERRSRSGAGDVVGLLSILVDLDLAGDGGVLPLDLNGVAGLHIDGLILLVQRIALGCLQFPDIEAALALGDGVVNIDVSVLVGGILADGVLVGII